MIFLIEYSREKGQMVSLRRFEDSERDTADDARLELEKRLNRLGISHEVVTLEASSEELLHKTHWRYFSTFETFMPALV